MNTIKQRLRAALRHARRDMRGVALQTVIVIVVLLMIAGGVSAVLLSRSSDVVGQLEAQGVGAITEDNCAITKVGGENGTPVRAEVNTDGELAELSSSTGMTHCVWPGDVVTPAQCFAAGNGKMIEADVQNFPFPTSHSHPSAAGEEDCVAEIA
ncbi:MAG: hypothetical protein F4117_05650 [Acidimicrobiales bacterium]|nr:hypothetical protein [Acidimicrobiales bacterium]MYI12033.1 hypothetical protein [Acidimicrobiales bacterium]